MKNVTITMEDSVADWARSKDITYTGFTMLAVNAGLHDRIDDRQVLTIVHADHIVFIDRLYSDDFFPGVSEMAENIRQIVFALLIIIF